MNIDTTSVKPGELSVTCTTAGTSCGKAKGKTLIEIGTGNRYCHHVFMLHNPESFGLDCVFIVQTERNFWRLLVQINDRLVTDIEFHNLIVAKKIFIAKHMTIGNDSRRPLWKRHQEHHCMQIDRFFEMPKLSIIEQLLDFIRTYENKTHINHYDSFLCLMSAIIRVSYSNSKAQIGTTLRTYHGKENLKEAA